MYSSAGWSVVAGCCQMKLVSEGTGTTYLFAIALVTSVNSVTAKEFPVFVTIVLGSLKFGE